MEFPQKNRKNQKKINNYCDINFCGNKMPVGHNALSFYMGFGMHLCTVHRTIGKKRVRENLAQRAMGPLDPTLGLVNRGLVCTFVPSATSHPLRLPTRCDFPKVHIYLIIIIFLFFVFWFLGKLNRALKYSMVH